MEESSPPFFRKKNRTSYCSKPSQNQHDTRPTSGLEFSRSFVQVKGSSVCALKEVDGRRPPFFWSRFSAPFEERTGKSKDGQDVLPHEVPFNAISTISDGRSICRVSRSSKRTRCFTHNQLLQRTLQSSTWENVTVTVKQRNSLSLKLKQ